MVRPRPRHLPMFDALAKGFRQARNRLAGLTELTEANIDAALREVRLSLLEADVELGVVKAFLARVKEKALGETVQTPRRSTGGRRRIKVSRGRSVHQDLPRRARRDDDHEGEPLDVRRQARRPAS